MLGTAPIPAGPYHDPAYYTLERVAVFKRAWLHIGHVSELPQPGSFIVRNIEAARASILIVRGKDGTITSLLQCLYSSRHGIGRAKQRCGNDI